MSRRPSLERRLSELPTLDQAALAIEYQRLHGSVPAASLSPKGIQLAIANRLQQQLITRLRSQMHQVLSAAESIVNVVATASADTILVRDWKGSCHEVTIVQEGVMYRDQWYASLDEVARLITRGKRSGDQFFGPEVVNGGR